MAVQSKPYGIIIAALIARRPITNRSWSYDARANSFSAEISTLTAFSNPPCDPWDQPLAAPNDTERDGEGEVSAWSTIATMDGIHVELFIIND